MSVVKPPSPTFDEATAIMKLYVAAPARVELDRVPAVLGLPAADWLGQPISQLGDESRRYACDLELRVGPDRRATFRKSAIVSLGVLGRADGTWTIPIGWRAATLAPLFPVFVGQLQIQADRIELDGHYAPPGGALGYVLDRALLHIAARGTGRWFLAKVLVALDGAP